MTTDIVSRLRFAASDGRKDTWGLYREAADEIERLRKYRLVYDKAARTIIARAVAEAREPASRGEAEGT